MDMYIFYSINVKYNMNSINGVEYGRGTVLALDKTMPNRK